MFIFCVCVCMCVCVSVGAENLISTLIFKISSHAINVVFFIKFQKLPGMSRCYSGVFLKPCMRLFVCAVGYKFMHFCAVSPRSAVSDKHVFTICGIGRQREVKFPLPLSKEKKPTWCHLFYYLFNTHSLLNMFRPLIRPSSGVCD